VEQRLAQPLSIGGVVIVLTFLSLVVGELVPKRIALLNPDGIASAVARTIAVLSSVAHPVVSFLEISTDAVLRALGMKSVERAPVTDDEINALVGEGAEQGSIDPAERQMVEQVLRLADRPVRTIMTRRRDIVWLDVHDAEEAVRTKLADNAYSRLLVCDETLDNCLGYVRARALVDRLIEQAPLELRSLIREPLRVTPELKTLVLMARFRRARPHLALVTDEYGTTLGLVTPADVMESIGGHLPEDAAGEPRVMRRDRNSWLVDAGIELHELERAVGAGGLATKHPFMTLAGLLLEHFRRIPLVGEVMVADGWRLKVMAIDGNRITRVLASRLSDTARVLDDAHAFGRAAAAAATPAPQDRASSHKSGLLFVRAAARTPREHGHLHRWEDDGGRARRAP
jgi:putative hemolysin